MLFTHIAELVYLGSFFQMKISFWFFCNGCWWSC